MSLVEIIKMQLLEARKAKNEIAKNILSVALGDIQTQAGRAGQKGEITEQQAEKIIQKLIKSNQETLLAMVKAESAGATLPVEKLQKENEILKTLLPKACSREEIKNHLIIVADKLKEAKSDGQATGLAMKELASLEGSKDGKIVAEVVKEIRS